MAAVEYSNEAMEILRRSHNNDGEVISKLLPQPKKEGGMYKTELQSLLVG